MTEESPVKTQIRLPAELHQRLNGAAEASGRSFNAEMVYRLEKSFPSSIEVELLKARQDELLRLQNEMRSLNQEIADLSVQLSQPSKRKMRAEIQENIALLSRRQIDIQRMKLRTEIEIDKLLESEPAAEPLKSMDELREELRASVSQTKAKA